MADAKSAENWFAKVHCGLDADKLLLRGLTGTEGLSRPFRFQAEFISEDTDVDFGQVVGKPMAIELAASESSATRYFHGVVARFAQDDSEGGFAIYRAELVPWIGLLARSSHTRTWPEKETKSILKEVLDLAPNASMVAWTIFSAPSYFVGSPEKNRTSQPGARALIASTAFLPRSSLRPTIMIRGTPASAS